MTRGAGGDVRWCTPQVYLDAVEAYAPIYFDPCWDPNSIVKCQRAFSVHAAPETRWTPEWWRVADSLAEPWGNQGGVAPAPRKEGKCCLTFVNPPYGRSHNQKWMEKIKLEGRAAAALDASLIAMVPASTASRWFLGYVESATCIFFPTGRIKFIGAGDESPSFDVCFVYYGPNSHQFRTAFHSKLVGWSR